MSEIDDPEDVLVEILYRDVASCLRRVPGLFEDRDVLQGSYGIAPRWAQRIAHEAEFRWIRSKRESAFAIAERALRAGLLNPSVRGPIWVIVETLPADQQPDAIVAYLDSITDGAA